jgi:hypothetical protein
MKHRNLLTTAAEDPTKQGADGGTWLAAAIERMDP